MVHWRILWTERAPRKRNPGALPALTTARAARACADAADFLGHQLPPPGENPEKCAGERLAPFPFSPGQKSDPLPPDAGGRAFSRSAPPAGAPPRGPGGGAPGIPRRAGPRVRGLEQLERRRLPGQAPGPGAAVRRDTRPPRHPPREAKHRVVTSTPAAREGLGSSGPCRGQCPPRWSPPSARGKGPVAC